MIMNTKTRQDKTSKECLTNLISRNLYLERSTYFVILNVLMLLVCRWNFISSNSNKSPTRCNSFPVYYPDVYLQLNMSRAFSRPSSGAQLLQWQRLVLPASRGVGRAIFVVGPTTNRARLSPRYEGKTRGCHCSHWAPDDGRKNARNMLSCK